MSRLATAFLTLLGAVIVVATVALGVFRLYAR